MDCETFRQITAGDPAELDEQCVAHARDCPACAAFSERVRSAEWLIHEAMRFDVAALKSHAGRPARRWATSPRAGWAGVAAVLIAGLAVWFGSSRGPDLSEELLVAEILEHWHLEPESWDTTDVRISPASLEEVIGGQVDVNVNQLGLVSYARSCFVRDNWVPHLVIQGERGPVMLLLLPDEPISEPLPLDMPEQGLQGVILPLGGGSVAVLGTDGEAMEPIRQRVSDALEWSI